MQPAHSQAACENINAKHPKKPALDCTKTTKTTKQVNPPYDGDFGAGSFQEKFFKFFLGKGMYRA